MTTKRDWRALLAPLTHLTEAEAARILGVAPSTIHRARRAHQDLAGPKGQRGRKEGERPGHLHIRASEAELAQLEGLASGWQTTATDAVWRAVAQALRHR